MNKKIIWGIVAVVIVAAGVFAFNYIQHQLDCCGGEDTEASPAASTSTWKTYTNDNYGYQISYPSDWIMDANLFSLSDEYTDTVFPADGVFCLPELQDKNMKNGISGEPGSCAIGRTNGGSINPKAPISLFQCPIGNSSEPVCSDGIKFGVDSSNKFSYTLRLGNSKYQQIYEQIAKTFKFTN